MHEFHGQIWRHDMYTWTMDLVFPYGSTQLIFPFVYTVNQLKRDALAARHKASKGAEAGSALDAIVCALSMPVPMSVSVRVCI